MQNWKARILKIRAPDELGVHFSVLVFIASYNTGEITDKL
jgi:hypothetical protein